MRSVRARHRLPSLLAALLLLPGVSGCASVRHRASAPRVVPALPSGIAAYYDYPSHTPQAERTQTADHARHTEWLVRFPLSVPADLEPTEPIVEVEWFESKEPGRRPAILLNPILGGDYPLERGICRFFARHGYHVAMPRRKTLKISPEHKIERIELLLRQGVIRIRQVVDWMSAQEHVDPDRLGSFGISMGGIAGVITAAVEPRLKVHVVALAGGSIPDILVTSKDSLLTTPLRKYLERNRMDRATMERQLRDTVKTDPLALAPYIDPDELIMFITLLDRTVGRANELRLWRALGRPTATFMPLGHYTALASLPYLKFASLRFFRGRL
jgi:hypothetical protein